MSNCGSAARGASAALALSASICVEFPPTFFSSIKHGARMNADKNGNRNYSTNCGPRRYTQLDVDK